ncbi:thioesterase II family protein [Hymenobacter rubripertinctus]|uniref:thioesterase II family protein n=1 Tax=Hymenobacter rubripertinctus TaxID=2029981 RepID=UPI0016042956|nr:thioesterase [Hymenobacter rubripertinctus]
MQAGSPADPVTVYCIPFAGGSANSFSTYKAQDFPGLQFQALELPGRGLRGEAPLLTCLEAILDDYWQQLVPLVTAAQKPYVLWGHSMGAAITGWLTARLLREQVRSPLFLLHTSKVATRQPTDLVLHRLPEQQFIAELRQLGGLPAFLSDGSDLLRQFLPIIRADIRALESYTQPPPTGLPVPIRVLVSRQERPTPTEWGRWQQESSASVAYQEVAGDHFFIYRNRPAVGEQLRLGVAAGRPAPGPARAPDRFTISP